MTVISPGAMFGIASRIVLTEAAVAVTEIGPDTTPLIVRLIVPVAPLDTVRVATS